MEKYDVFISYSRHDSKAVHKVSKALQTAGYSVWIDIDGIESGEAFRSVIVNAIEQSKIVLFFSSSASNASNWTTKELSLAVDENKFIIPIKLDPTKYNNSIRFDLIDLDYIDMSSADLEEIAVKRLLKSIKSQLDERDTNNITDISGKDIPSDGINRTSFNLKPSYLKETIVTNWNNRNPIINIILCIYGLIAICGFIIPNLGLIFAPASIIGIIAVFYLLFNKKNGFAFITASCLLWTLGNAYVMSPCSTTFRFFSQSPMLIILPPVIIMIGSFFLPLIKNKGTYWKEQLDKLDVFGIVVLTGSIIFWLWIIYFDAVTKFGLSPNLRHYVARIFN